jgi:hypothetical protein
MDPVLQQFAEEANSKSVYRLVALSELVRGISPAKMEKAKTIRLNWEEVDGEVVPSINMEFFE